MKLRYLIATLSFCFAAHVPVAQAAYPDKPIRIVVPWAAGGSTDALARAVAQRMSESMGQPVVVENRAGASGRIGAEAVAKAAPDGYTLGVIELAHTVAPAVFRQMPYDLLRDFTPVSLLGESPLVLFADSTRYRAGEAQRFLADARKQGKPLQLATSGNGTISHLAAKMFEAQAGVPIDAVPYRGSAPALTDVSAQLVAGHFATLASGSSLLGAGKITALMVTGPARIPALPNVPTAAEAKLPSLQISQWWAIVAPARTPSTVVSKLGDEVRAALANPQTKARLDSQGIDLKASSPAQLGDRLRGEVDRWAALVKQARIQPE
ncbi:tripartite tricarboxylate transporter substrate binding protein [Cupriavidus gilardii]|uniref:tripartite tricarboxylate transporter substrate binding protein n=1 Tax=Cupriavidus gilardii TaxID=82541 RepID=UPI001580981E|nr:tripartite tricarboxylate transporter substrate binding protein [Cupriavidus gilardii]MCT9074012.1 tripartite tricarboxylate transporter substrate binding protein [Cupriavidus gilardii]QKS61771.1 tripartite tricarboxylate transporter substrate binding protein [Cupriavidus gilardii]